MLAFFPSHFSFLFYTSASSLPVVYFNVLWTEQLVVTWGWLCCSHSDRFKGGQGRHHCCLWSVGDSPACCTSSTLASSWCEESRARMHGSDRPCRGPVVLLGFGLLKNASQITLFPFILGYHYLKAKSDLVLKCKPFIYKFIIYFYLVYLHLTFICNFTY